MPVEIKYCAPNTVLTVGIGNQFNLTKAFYNVRYNDEGGVRDGNSFGRNAGAGQLFRTNGDPKDTPVGALSGGKYNETYAHSERLVMRNILDTEIPLNNGELERPGHITYIRDKQKPEAEKLKHLTDHATNYKAYLARKNLVVKMWSEYEPCSGKMETDNGWIDREGGSCQGFVQNICPDGSIYRHIIPNKGDKENKAPMTTIQTKQGFKKIVDVQKVSREFKIAFEKFLKEQRESEDIFAITSKIGKCTLSEAVSNCGTVDEERELFHKDLEGTEYMSFRKRCTIPKLFELWQKAQPVQAPVLWSYLDGDLSDDDASRQDMDARLGAHHDDEPDIEVSGSDTEYYD